MKKKGNLGYQKTKELIASFHTCLGEPHMVSSNHLYTSIHGRAVLSRAGRAFKAALTREVAQAVAPLGWGRVVDLVYARQAFCEVDVVVCTTLLHANWRLGRLTPSNVRQLPFKAIDAPNYGKATIDAVVAGTGLDDSTHLRTTFYKEASRSPAIEVFFYVYRGFAT